MKLTPEQLRALENLAVSYDGWMQALRAAPQLDGWLMWKARNGKEYLYKARNRRGQSRSLGPRSPETEALYGEYDARRAGRNAARKRARATYSAMADTLRIYRTLRLPVIDAMAGRILREADERGLLGGTLLVVGTNTMAAYEIEARERFATGYDSTNDFDLTWAAREPTVRTMRSVSDAPIMDMLKEVDDTFTLNLEKEFQARNAKAYEVEILIAPSLAAHYPHGEPLRPVPLPEQEWLLMGHPVSHVVLDRDLVPARIVAPDPRWMALHKLWLADKPGRNPLKVDKDRAQGGLLLAAVRRCMPHYPVDDAFIADVPEMLLRYLT
ncbi:MAG: GSU2403 family nucleotidyltransferase fold protein [Sinimarinibacterium sp.]|jgi:hypothetical protein